jgi:Arc/MetJ-type ribon-helix-helix transcriptional regulator/predicted transcriptional regulator
MEFRINIKDWLVPRIEEAVNGGDYENASEFINLAVEDKLEGPKSSAPSIDQYFSKDGGHAQYNISSHDADQSSGHSSNYLRKDPNVAAMGRKYGQGYPLPQILRMASVKPISNNLQKPALEIFDQNTIIWGQINRFFPIKIGLLTIAQYIKESGDEYNLVSMQDAIDHVKSSVRNIGEFLKQIDDKYGKKGPEKLSVGFASGDGLKLDKGLARFTSHFVLRYRKTDKKMEGALVKLGFLRAYNMNGSGIKVGITESGLKFLNLSNPIVDSLAENESSIAIPNVPNKILSEEEKSFIIEIIAELIPVDYKAMQTVLRLIDTGDNTQAKIQNGLQGNEDFGNGQAMIDTNKNGIIARLTALELIGRNKQSLNVEYYLTDAGKKIRSSK